MEHTLTSDLAHDLDGAFEALLGEYGARLYRFALRLMGNPQDAEEVAQDALIRAYRALSGYDAARIRALQLKPWMYRITLNVVRNRVRRRTLEIVPLDGDIPQQEAQESPERCLLAAEQRTEMAALLAELPERYRVPVVLRHVEDLSYDEIGKALGQPIGTVKANVHRGIGMLRVMVEGEVAV